MKISFLAIGDELITGRVQDSNGKYFADKLSLFNLEMKFMMMAGDDQKDMFTAFDFLSANSDAIICSGGLGPTPDDLTIDVFAQYINRPLELHADILEKLEQRFKIRGIPMPATNKKQAMIPSGATVIENPVGTAPGTEAEYKGRRWFFLPGVPSEFKVMVDRSIIPRLLELEQEKRAVFYRTLRVYGLPESGIAERLMKLNFDPRLKIAYLPELPEIYLRLSATSKDKADAEQIVTASKEMIKAELKEYVFSENDEPMEIVVGNLLRKNRLTIATAESCTGGLVAKRITDVAGSSNYFLGGFVTYANEMKTSELGVSEELLKTKGAVNSEVARAMAEGARKKSGADIAIALTGLSGPAGGTPEKPVGTAHIALADKNGVWENRFQFMPWSREMVRSLSAETALEIVRRRILGLRMPGEK
jgi:nicotinamide-nucleotide amidase